MASGRMIPDDFELERTIGTGAFSTVLVARYIPDGKRYAVKVISKNKILNAPSQEDKQRLADLAKRESRILLMCSHPHILKFHAAMQTADDLMYVTELCDGGELLDAIKKRGTLPLPATRYVIAEILSALRYLHSGEKHSFPFVINAPLQKNCILHRDIKPENIMLSHEKHVKLIDFGTAIVCHNEDEHPSDERGGALGPQVSRARATTFCGTTHYMSPELLQENFTCTASDIWAVGCVLYHMLTGQRPFEASTPYLLIKQILEDEVAFPANMEPNAKDLCSQMLVKDPAKRIAMDAIAEHPFFAEIEDRDWSNLHKIDVRALWIRDATWMKDTDAAACTKCEMPFSLFNRKHHCRNCGKIFCKLCSSKQCIIPESTYTSQERVCDGCFTKLHQL